MSLQRTVDGLPTRYAGPGGGVAVLRDGELLARHCWGWANAEARVAFTPATPFLVCSITKEFTCALLLDRFGDPSVLDAEVARALPDLGERPPGVIDLCHNQSGSRDYWAAAMLCGAPVEGRFGDEDARRLIGRTRTLQFAPGTRYSYCNQNFRILSDAMERRLDRPFDELLRSHVLEPVGMAHAGLNPETGTVRGGTVGYEGSAETGFRPAVNRIRWTGDAGLAATLDDMIAWERAVDAGHSLYTRLAVPVAFRDGAEAAYGFGLSRAKLLGHAAFSHGGGLRGWRSFPAYLPGPRVSVVVMFNHMADARAAALELLGAVVTPAEEPPPRADVPAGRYRDTETGLAVRVEAAAAPGLHGGERHDRAGAAGRGLDGRSAHRRRAALDGPAGGEPLGGARTGRGGVVRDRGGVSLR